jgi:transcriptional regulator with XRE-family HTH domain
VAGIVGRVSTKSQHSLAYAPLPAFLRTLREDAGLTQRELGNGLGKPQSWVHNCEVGNRRIDVTEFAAWATACGVKPTTALGRFLRASA